MQLYSCTYIHTYHQYRTFPSSIYPPVELHVLNHRVKEEKRGKEMMLSCRLVIQVFWNTLDCGGKGKGEGKMKEKKRERGSEKERDWRRVEEYSVNNCYSAVLLCKKEIEAVVVILSIWPQSIAEEKGMTGSWVSCIAITEKKHDHTITIGRQKMISTVLKNASTSQWKMTWFQPRILSLNRTSWCLTSRSETRLGRKQEKKKPCIQFTCSEMISVPAVTRVHDPLQLTDLWFDPLS